MSDTLSSKMKLIRKYMGESKFQKQTDAALNNSNTYYQDNDDIVPQQIQSSDQQSKEKIRIGSSDEQENSQKPQKKKQKLCKAQRKLRKKIRKALGLKKSDDFQEFMKEVKIEGVEEKDLQEMLSGNSKIELASEETRKKPKKKGKCPETKTEEHRKFQAFEQSSSSDLNIPAQYRNNTTIYRNKKGVIQTQNQEEQKEQLKQKVMQRLAGWDRGMKKDDSDQEDDQVLAHSKKNIFDDPFRVWEECHNMPKPFSCKFMGPCNRFNIKPGFRWDGVIRGNGYQNTYLQQVNIRKAHQQSKQQKYLKEL